MKTKDEVRKELKTAIHALGPEEKTRQSALLCQRVLNAPLLQRCRSVGIYLPLPDEPDLRPALQQLLEGGIQLALPFPERKISSPACGSAGWAFHLIHHLQPNQTGPWDLDLPEAGKAIPSSDLDVILIPGRGFTTRGDRIGRGKGIYDRLLRHTSAHKIGVGFNCQLVEQLPRETHDIRLDDIWIG